MTTDTPPPAPPETESPPAARRALSPWPVVAALALVLGAWQWYDTDRRFEALQTDGQRQTAQAQEAVGVQKSLREQIDALQARQGALEARLEDFEGQGDSLRTLFQEMNRSREDIAMLEVEQAIALAVQQLQLSGNVPVALLALRSADTQLARIERAELLPLRKALAHDIDSLTRVPLVDTAGISLRLEQVVSGIDEWPLASLQRPVAGGLAEAADDAPRPAWQQALHDIWRQVRDLVRIQRFDSAEAPLLAPGQEFFLRDNLKLRLLNARLALFARDQATFRNELKVAQGWLERHFTLTDKRVATARDALRELLATDIAVDVPDLKETRQVLASLRQRKEKR